MNVTSDTLAGKIARAEAAVKQGQIDNYAPAKAHKASETKLPSSWGPMMRV